jgi:hypothetical protein
MERTKRGIIVNAFLFALEAIEKLQNCRVSKCSQICYIEHIEGENEKEENFKD